MNIIKKGLLFTLAFPVLFSCAKEKKQYTEKELLVEIKSNVEDSIFNEKKFKEKTYPLIEELKEIDSVKYQMVIHIGRKIKEGSNTDVLPQNYKDLRSELNFVN